MYQANVITYTFPTRGMFVVEVQFTRQQNGRWSVSCEQVFDNGAKGVIQLYPSVVSQANEFNASEYFMIFSNNRIK